MPAKFVLIGSGLAGGLLAAYLGRRGYEVDLHERRADPREGNIVGGRSINLAISTRGIHALEQIGIADEALRHAIPMRGRMIHDKAGALHFAPYDVDPKNCINSIGRASLNTTVIEAAQRYPSVRVHFNRKCTDVDLTEAVCRLETETGKLAVRGDAVIGVDGAFSAVRASMQRNIDSFQYNESYLAHGYKELTIPPAPDGSWLIEKNALHIWPRKSFMMIALPNPDGSFTYRDRVCLLGDAAHAVVPFYGQGMNAAFEDCIVLDECLDKFADNRERAFAEYFERRKENADALADLAIGNFIEMRDKTASRAFRAKKKLDHLLEAALPGVYLPLYTLVTFTRIPYAQAARRARLQDRILYAALVLIGILALAVLLALSQRQ
ncbi:MAG: kynurenine 3-monooxygenase [Verrucomicrobia bacterium]|nr:MAG: kynurenine 3-monooxygenase [Verrucomicrobiota bacterium]